MSQPAESIAERAYNVLVRSFRVLRSASARSELTLERLSVLQTIERSGPLSVADLAASEAVHPSTMSRMVSGLTRQRLIRRLADQNDGRGTLVVSTSHGRSVAKRALGPIMRDLVAAVSKLNARERAELEDALRLVERLVLPARPGR